MADHRFWPRTNHMTNRHLELLVEEPSMGAFLEATLPHLLPAECTFEIRAFQSKDDLLRKLPDRLRAYRRFLPDSWRVIVMIDRDNADCRQVKANLEAQSLQAALITRTQAGNAGWQVVNRVVIEELEAWYFGDWEAVRRAYPKLSPNTPKQSRYRDPDAIKGGTWEAFQRVLQARGYYSQGLAKVEAAKKIGPFIDPERNRSHSFKKFYEAIIEATACLVPDDDANDE